MSKTAIEATRAEFVERATSAFRELLAALLESAEVPGEAPEDLGVRAGLTAAAASVWSAHAGPFLDTEGVMRLLGGITKQAVSQRARTGRLLALRTGSGRLVYPLWQFRDGEPLPGLAAVLAAAGVDLERPVSGWTVASWLCTEDPELGGAPRDLLAAGAVDAVTCAAADVRLELGVEEVTAATADDAVMRAAAEGRAEIRSLVAAPGAV